MFSGVCMLFTSMWFKGNPCIFFYSLAKRSPHGARADRPPFVLSFELGEREMGLYLLEQHGGSTGFKYASHKRQHRNISRLVKGSVHARAQMVGITSTLPAAKRIAGEASSRMACGQFTRRCFCDKRPLRSHHQEIALPWWQLPKTMLY